MAYIKRRPEKPAPQPAVLDMTKVLAAVEARKPAQPADLDMARVKAAVANREHKARAPRAIHMTLPAEDAARRGYVARIGGGCSGFNCGSFLNDSAD